MKAANGVAASPRHELMQTREQTEMLIAMRIAELRHLALRTSGACAALDSGRRCRRTNMRGCAKRCCATSRTRAPANSRSPRRVRSKRPLPIWLGADALRTFACGFDESTTSRVSTIRRPEPPRMGSLITRPKLLYGEQPATARRDLSVHRPLGIRFIAFRKAARFECLLQANLQKWSHWHSPVSRTGLEIER